MKCDAVNDKMVDFLGGSLEMPERKQVEAHLETCAGCREEVAVLNKVRDRMKELHVPEPSEKMHQNFYGMLTRYKEEKADRRVPQWLEKFRALWHPQRLPSVAYTLLVLAIGALVGLLISPVNRYDGQLEALHGEVQQMREMMLLTLLQQPSATDRLKAVSMSNKLNRADEKVINALLRTLNHDPNVNVRLLAVEALAKMADYPEVRLGLVRSISRQESPMVQIALADAMVILQEKRSVDELRKLLEERQLHEVVRGKFEETIAILS